MPQDAEGRLEGEPLGSDQLRTISIFQGCSEALLKKNLGAVVRRRFQPGEIICREGEFGSTAFYILEGEAEVFLKTPVAHLEGKARVRGLFGGITSFLQSLVRSEAPRTERGSIPIDAPVDLTDVYPTLLGLLDIEISDQIEVLLESVLRRNAFHLGNILGG